LVIIFYFGYCNLVIGHYPFKGVSMMVFIIVGMPASGKNIAREYAEKHNISYFATGDIVREEVKKQALEANAENTAAVSTKLRGNDGMGVTRVALETALACPGDIVFLEGIRSWPEVELIREQTDCCVVAFLAPRELRHQRVASRGRSDDSPAAFEERDTREIAYGAAIPIARADAYVLNTATMDNAMTDIDRIVTSYRDKGTKTGLPQMNKIK
jgi:dephospho-CoA kinase